MEGGVAESYLGLSFGEHFSPLGETQEAAKLADQWGAFGGGRQRYPRTAKRRKESEVRDLPSKGLL